MTDQTQNVAESLTTDNVSTGAKSLSDNEDTENLYAVPDGVPQSASVGASVPTDTVSTGANVWIGDHVDESVNTDHAGTAAKISNDYDNPATLYADPAAPLLTTNNKASTTSTRLRRATTGRAF